MKKSFWISILFVSNVFCAACGSLVYAAPPSEKAVKSTPAKTKDAAKQEAQKAEAPQKSKEEFWVNIFPIGTSISDLEIDPQDPNILYAVTPKGLFNTLDGGKLWTLLSQFGNSGFIEIDPVSPKTFYWATKNKLWKSADGGLNWGDITAGVISNINSIIINPKSPEIMYVTTGGTLYKTLNGGKTWGKIEGKAYSVLLNPDLPDELYKTMKYVKETTGFPRSSRSLVGLFRSSNGGQKFELVGPKFTFIEKNPIGDRIRGGCAENVHALLNPFNTVELLSSCDESFMRSSDGGKTWNDISPKEFVETGKNVITGEKFNVYENFKLVSLAFSSQDTFYFAGKGDRTGKAKLLKFDNANQPGIPLSLPPLPSNLEIGSIKISPSNTIYLATNYGIYKTSDEGTTWESANYGLPGNMGGKSLLAVTDSIYVTDSSLRTGNVLAPSKSGYWVSNDNGKFWKLHFGPKGECQQATGCEYYMVDQMVTTPSFTYIRAGLKIFKMSLEGNLIEINIDKAAIQFAVSPSNSQVLYYISNVYELFKSEDAGFSWTQLHGPWHSVFMLYVAPQSPDIVYASVNQNIIKTSDGGKTWTDITPNLYKPMETVWAKSKWLHPSTRSEIVRMLISQPTSLVIDPSNSNIVYLTTLEGGAFRSDDGGKNWTILQKDYLENLVHRCDEFLTSYQVFTERCKKKKDCKASMDDIRFFGYITINPSFKSVDRQPTHFNNISINPTDTKNVYLSTSGAVLKSFDRGKTWQRPLWAEDNIRKVIASPLGVFAEGESGIYKLMELPQ